MKINRCLLVSFSILWIVTFSLLMTSCCHQLSGHGPASDGATSKLPLHLKYRIDGSFDGWTNCKVAETAKNLDWDAFQFHSEYPDIDSEKIKRFFYDNDDNYLYIFFKLDRTLDQIYGKRYVGFDFGELFFDIDMNTNTGCGASERSGVGALIGSELRIQIFGGFYAKNDSGGKFSGRYVYYDEASWDSLAQQFDKNVNHQDSIDASHRLIACGKDGMALAIPIDSFNNAKNGQFNMAYCPVWMPKDRVNWNLVDLKK